MNNSAAEHVTAIRRDLGGLTSLTTAHVRLVRRRHAKALDVDPAKTVVDVADALLTTGGWPERVVGCELVVGRPDAVQRLSRSLVERWALDLDDWGSVDLYGLTVAGIAWRERRLADGDILRWARSSNRWRRRLALVATVPLNSRARGGSGDPGRTMRVCQLLVADRDDMVIKALSWALRELGKRDHAAIREFVRAEGNRLARRVTREVTSKLETGRKA